jgi:hypothetical protein
MLLFAIWKEALCWVERSAYQNCLWLWIGLLIFDQQTGRIS